MNFQEWLDDSKPTTVRFMMFVRALWFTVGFVIGLLFR